MSAGSHVLHVRRWSAKIAPAGTQRVYALAVGDLGYGPHGPGGTVAITSMAPVKAVPKPQVPKP